MRFYFSTLLLFCVFNSFGQSLTWSDPVVVFDGGGNTRPRIELGTNNTPMVIWGTPGTNPVRFAKWDGSAFTPAVDVGPVGVDPYCSYWTGPDIAVNGDTVFVAFDADVNGFKAFVVRSVDGGDTFGDTVVVGGYANTNRFASIGIDNNGNPSVIFMTHDAGYSNPNYVTCTSKDKGETYGPMISGSNSITGDEVCDCCPAEVIGRGDQLIMLYRNNESNLRDIWVGISNDQGDSYTTGEDIDDASWVLNSCPSTGPDAIYRGDTIVAVWQTEGSGDGRVIIGQTSAVSGLSAVNQEIYNGAGAGFQNYPRIAGDIYTTGVVYQSNDSGTECYLAYSTDGANQLDYTHIPFTDDVNGHQRTPDVAYADGVFHIVYEDQSNTAIMYRTATLDNASIEEHGQTINAYVDQNSKFLNFQGLNPLTTYQIEIYDMQGKLVQSTPLLKGNKTCSVSDCVGNTIVRVLSNGEELKSMKLFIAR